MPTFKHVGRLVASRRKVIVAYRVVPGDPDYCLVVQTENCSADQHDALIREVESASGQSSYEFAESMARAYLPDGRNMLSAFQHMGMLNKMPTNEIEMVPNSNSQVLLSELNSTIAEQQGVTVNDLAVKGPDGKSAPLADTGTSQDPSIDTNALYTTPAPVTQPDGIMTDDDLAAQYRSQADALFKEAKALREQAEELVPTKKKTTKKVTETSDG